MQQMMENFIKPHAIHPPAYIEYLSSVHENGTRNPLAFPPADLFRLCLAQCQPYCHGIFQVAFDWQVLFIGRCASDFRFPFIATAYDGVVAIQFFVNAMVFKNLNQRFSKHPRFSILQIVYEVEIVTAINPLFKRFIRIVQTRHVKTHALQRITQSCRLFSSHNANPQEILHGRAGLLESPLTKPSVFKFKYTSKIRECKSAM
jgi:hypothetical protein